MPKNMEIKVTGYMLKALEIIKQNVENPEEPMTIPETAAWVIRQYARENVSEVLSEDDKEIVLCEVKSALERHDFIELQRIYSVLSPLPQFDEMIYEEISRAYDYSDDAGRVNATILCEGTAELREKDEKEDKRKAEENV